MVTAQTLEELVERSRAARKKAKNRRRALEPKFWTEADALNGEKTQAFCIVLPNRGCSWDKCTVCGYGTDCESAVREEDIAAAFFGAMKNYHGEKITKVFNSGSFFNDEEMPPAVRERIFSGFSGKVEKLIVETRAEHTNTEILASAAKAFPSLTVALGLESSNDDVLKKSVNKGMKFADYERAAQNILGAGLRVKSYLLLKPPFLSESEAIDDALASIRAAAKYSSEISLNPVNIQNYTVVEHLWRRGGYRPPWLWSVVKVLSDAKKTLPPGVRLLSQPTGGGTFRGAHNCRNCDEAVLAEIAEFSISQNPGVFKAECGCREQWLDALELEMLAHTSGDLGMAYGVGRRGDDE